MSDKIFSLRINSIGICQCGPSWSLTPARTRGWTDLDLWFLLEGHGAVDTPEGRHLLHPGSCLLMRGGQDYHFHQDPQSRFKHFFVHFDYLDKRDRPLPLTILELPPLIRRLTKIEFLASLLGRARTAFNAHPPNRPRAEQWFAIALAEATSNDHLLNETSPEARFEQIQWIERLCQRMRDNPEKSYSVASLAAEAGYSRSYFSSLFKSAAGMSPQEYVVQARMRAAEHHLLDSNYSVSAIAEMLGYRDIYFFSRQFKVQHGMSPLLYRNQVLRRSRMALKSGS